MPVANEAAVLRALTDVETLRRSLRLYPETHPALQPARERIKSSVAVLAAEASEATLGIGPDRILWNTEEVGVSASSPAVQLVRVLFNLGIGAVRLDLSRAAEGLAILGAKLSLLKEPPTEAERRSLLEVPDEFPGVELLPIDLSGVQVVGLDAEDVARGGFRNILRELAERLSRDGAFGLAGLVNEGELTAGMVAAMLQESRDPEGLFEHLFMQLGEVVRVRDEERRYALLAEVREFLGELLPLLDPGHACMAVAASFRHLPVAGDPERGVEPLLGAETLLDTVERMLLDGSPIPETVHRLLHRMAAPSSERPPEVTEETSCRARRLLAQIPLSQFHGGLTRGESFGLIMRPGSVAALHELTATLDRKALTAHLTLVLREAVTLWGNEPVGEAAARRLGDELVIAIDEGDLETATRLAPLVAALRVPAARDAACAAATNAVVRALRGLEKDTHATLASLLFALGEGALPAILQAIAEEETLGVRKRLLEVVGQFGAIALPHLRPLLSDSRWYVVRNALLLMRRLGDREAGPQLRLMLGRARPQVVEEILKTLVTLQDPQWFPALTRTLDSDDPERQIAAVRVASHIRHPQVAQALVERLRARSGSRLKEPLTLELIHAAARQGNPAFLPALKSILGLGQWRFTFSLASLKREAAAAIAHLEGSEAAQLARKLAADKDTELAAAVRAALQTPRKAGEEAE